MKLRENFLCAKKTKIMTLFNDFFSSVSEFNAHSRQYHEKMKKKKISKDGLNLSKDFVLKTILIYLFD